MSKTDLSNLDDTNSAVPPAETALTQPAPAELATNDEFFSNSGFDGEFNKSDIRMPYLSLVHGVGDLSKLGFLPGSLVYNREVVVAEPVKGVMLPEAGAFMIPLRGYKEFVETITDEQFKAGIKARRFRKEIDARNAGLISKKEARESKATNTFTPALQVQCLIRAPKNVNGKPFEGNFALEHNGESYAMAALALGKGSYWGAGLVLNQAMQEVAMLKRLNWSVSFWLYSKNETFPGSTNAGWSIKAKGAGKVDAALQQFITDLMSNAS